MYIKEIDIKSFGSICDKRFVLSSGFNLIYGPNESGKTTLLSFLVFMFYGTKIRKNNDKLLFKDRYMPWNGRPMEGQICFESNGMDYVLRRAYSPERNFISLYCQSTGENIKDTAILKSPGDYFLGINVDTFCKTAYFSSLSAGINKENSDEIITKLRNLFESAATEMSYKKISDEICKEISSLISNKRKNAVIPALELQIKNLNNKLSEAKDNENQAAVLNNKIRDNNLRTQELKRNLDEINFEVNKRDFDKKTDTQNTIADKGLYLHLVLFALFIISAFTFTYNRHIGLTLFCFNAILLLVYVLKLLQTKKCTKNKKERKDFTLEHFNDKIKVLQDEISELKVCNAVTMERLDNFKKIDISEIKSKLFHLQEELNTKKQRVDALNLALEALEAGYNDMKTIFSPELSKNASSVLASITGGKYNQILVDDNFEISVSGSEGFNSVNYLSRATLEQTYLALRLALVSLVCSKENTPVILDDAFAFYDFQRIEYAIEYINDLSRNKQIIFATCKTDEYDILRKKNRINIIKIS